MRKTPQFSSMKIRREAKNNEVKHHKEDVGGLVSVIKKGKSSVKY